MGKVKLFKAGHLFGRHKDNWVYSLEGINNHGEAVLKQDRPIGDKQPPLVLSVNIKSLLDPTKFEIISERDFYDEERFNHGQEY